MAETITETLERPQIISKDKDVEKGIWIELRDEKLIELFEYLPDGREYEAEDFRYLLKAAEREQAEMAQQDRERNREIIRILGSVITRLKKVIREYEIPKQKYRGIKSPEEKYGSKEALYKTFDLD